MQLDHPTLRGSTIRLEPLAQHHAADLALACADSADGSRSIWRYLLDARIYRASGMDGLVRSLLERRGAGSDLPFAIVELDSGRAVGTTRFMEIELDNRVVEIGTWIGLAHQGGGINLESKYLMLQHAFERLGVARVQFKIDHRNLASIAAVERLHAQREGVLRNHIVLADGTARSSVYYSMLDSEWPALEIHLRTLLARGRRAAGAAAGAPCEHG
ncbi:GNAT family N-acetyltransferase [Rugamonas rubra]|uniref:Protein N-acetyltransferase, RimJ/RimL family n=1 Tax=Rugamonas rubra TaxID=758825 RepID=A0A1I4P5T6_9BURK|nr:GNAT family protein [Rugamonas rubra]SFM23151.1 Protein N-acetyltransferase, RimJ/RimL family [Rugamonas rubra]